MSNTNKEDPTVSVTEAICNVMRDVRAVGKAEKHGQGWSFRGVDAVVNAIGPACRQRGLVILPEVLDHKVEALTGGQGKTVRSVTVVVRYTLVGPAGDSVGIVSVGEAMDHGDKATAKAMSVAWRTALIQAFLLPTDEPDPDHDVYEVQAVEFDPTDPTTWPESLSASAAKKAVLAAVGGDKDEAKALWSQVGEWEGWTRAELSKFLAAGAWL
jgi:hypothetical protein